MFDSMLRLFFSNPLLVVVVVLAAVYILASLHRIGPTELGLVTKRLSFTKLAKDNPVAFNGEAGYQADLLMPAKMPKLPDDVSLCIFRISQECLQNIARHSGAQKCRLVLEYSNDQVQLIVSDSGRGFVRSEAIAGGGVGLLSMEERALSIGGCVTVTSGRGSGTEIRLAIPLQKEAAPTAG